jgi:hypothetical protein
MPFVPIDPLLFALATMPHVRVFQRNATIASHTPFQLSRAIVLKRYILGFDWLGSTQGGAGGCFLWLALHPSRHTVESA